jgi:hypothetical protein
VRNSCEDGFLTVIKNRALVQTTGLDVNHADAEIVKETCFLSADGGDRLKGLSGGPFVRYFHKKSERYLCFNKHGKIRTMTGGKARRKGRLCMFLEESVEGEQVYHRVRSAHNSQWLLGFNPKRTTGVKGSSFRASLPRHGGVGFRPKKCDFKFFSGHPPKKDKWTGIIELLKTLDTSENEDIEDVPVITKAATDYSENSETLDNRQVSRNRAIDHLNSVKIDSNDKLEEPKPVRKTKISSAHREKLLMQQFLMREKERSRKIRHFKHKKPRAPRRPRLKKNQKFSKIAERRRPASGHSRGAARPRNPRW